MDFDDAWPSADATRQRSLIAADETATLLQQSERRLQRVYQRLNDSDSRVRRGPSRRRASTAGRPTTTAALMCTTRQSARKTG